MVQKDYTNFLKTPSPKLYKKVSKIIVKNVTLVVVNKKLKIYSVFEIHILINWF